MSKGSMDIDAPNESDVGEGLPYAPINWPTRGDNWSWKAGKRAHNGYYMDRYLYLPTRLHNCEKSTPKKTRFASKLSVERYIRSNFPDADVDAFFASFSWRIPSKQLLKNGKLDGQTSSIGPSEEIAEHSASSSQLHAVGCKAESNICSVLQAENSISTAMPCDICCSEPRFCRDCCCILCCKTISSSYGGYSYIRCEAKVGESYICGHAAHVDCALRCYLAGTVGGSIGLDAEYCCRRCDARTDLVSHATRMLETCESIDCRDGIEKILNVAICILRGSQKMKAIQLLNRVESAITKLKCGVSLEDIWKLEDNFSAIPNGISDHKNDVSEGVNDQIEFAQLEDEIDQVLQALKSSQELEYKHAEESLYAQKNYLRNLYQQLDQEKSDLANPASPSEQDALQDAVLKRVDQINREVLKLRKMERVAKGFGKTSNRILRKHFNFGIDD